MNVFCRHNLDRTLPGAAAAAVVLLLADAVLQRDVARIGMLAGLAALLVASRGRARVAGGRRGELSPVPSPKLATLQRRNDPDGTSTDSEISIVCADIRNFTRFTERTSSADVMRFLREYYAAAGDAVAAYGGTIKDYAGDGILVLVGAPQPLADHADRAVQMAAAMREAVLDVIARWSTDDLPLGIGIGVASGNVTIGMVGSRQRREYAAVGPAVNLAARLCGSAAAGDILIDHRTRRLACQADRRWSLRSQPALSLKGIDTPVTSYAL